MQFPELPKPYTSPQLLSHHENRVVLRVWSEDAHEHLVLKCLLPPFDVVDAEGFREEYLHLEALDHPNWVRPDHFGHFEGGGMWFSLELSDGVPLSEFPLRGWTPEVLEISRQILSALNALHLRGVAQIDLKPEQILVSWEGEGSVGWSGENEDGVGNRIKVHLLDLGLASEFGRDIGAAGTPGYLAPELLLGEEGWDERADLYAFGCVFFEAITGTPLFQGTDGRKLLRAQAAGVSVPERVSECGFDVSSVASERALPSILIDLIGNLVDRNPSRRIRDALDAWFRLRDVAGTGLTEFPLLNDSRSFPFCGREEEISAFVRWMDRIAERESGGRWECTLRGEIGIGKRRLARRLRSIAATQGWLVDSVSAHHRVHDAVLVFREESVFLPNKRSRNASPNVAISGQEGRDLVIDLRPLSRSVLEKLVLAAGTERGNLSEYLVECSLGNPHLMLHLIGRVPSELLLGTGAFSREEIVSFFDSASPPTEWEDWQDRFIEELSDEQERGLFEQCLREFGVRVNEKDAEVSQGEVGEVLWKDRLLESMDPFSKPADLVVDLGEIDTITLAMPKIWARAFLRRFGTGEKPIVREFLAGSSVGGAVAEEELVPYTKALGVLGVWPNPFLEPTIVRMSELGRFGDISPIFEAAVRGARAVPVLKCLSNDVLTNLLYGKSVSFDLVWKGGALFREREGALSEIGSEYSALFAFFDAYTVSDREAAIEFLEVVSVPDHEKLARVWYHGYSAALRHTRRGDELGSLWEKVREAHPESSQAFRDWFELERSGLLSPAPSRKVLEALTDRGNDIPDTLRGALFAKLAQLQIQAGDLEDAERSLHTSRSSFVRLGSLQSNAIDADLTAILYANGDIKSAMERSKVYFRRDVIAGGWNRALTFLFNWVLVASEVGEFQDCLSFLGSGWRFRVSGIHPHHEMGLRVLEAIVRVRVGKSDGIDALVRPGVDPPKQRAQHEICGAHRDFQFGDRKAATERFEAALSFFSGENLSDDRAEHVSYWLRLLCDAGDSDLCLRVYSKYGLESFSVANVGTRALLVAIQCEMCLEGWLAGPNPTELVEQSLDAQRDLDEIGFAPHAWKLSWRLATFLNRQGDSKWSGGFASDASQRLELLCQKLRQPEDVESFLLLPAPQNFQAWKSGVSREESG